MFTFERLFLWSCVMACMSMNIILTHTVFEQMNDITDLTQSLWLKEDEFDS